MLQLSGNTIDYRPQFSGHETFPIRYGWLQKVVGALEEQKDKNVFDPDEAMVSFGVGKNMVTSMRHWAKAVEVIDEKERLTEFGKKLLGRKGWDPYLERTTSLWLLHWKLAGTPQRSTTWYWIFNHLNASNFDRDFLAHEICKVIADNSVNGWGKVSPNTVKRDVECFVRTYCASASGSGAVTEDSLESPLSELELIVPSSLRGVYEFSRGRKSGLTEELFAHCLLEYWNKKNENSKTMTLERVAYEPGSPGRVFKLDENAVADYLLALEDVTEGAFRWSDAAGLRQIQLMQSEIPAYQFLEKAYEGL